MLEPITKVIGMYPFIDNGHTQAIIGMIEPRRSGIIIEIS